MLTEKRDSKNNTILSVEDLEGSATILVPQKAPEEVKKKALMLLPDQVFCVAVIKTRGDLLMAEDIIFPDVGRKTAAASTRTSLRCPHIRHPYWQHKIHQRILQTLHTVAMRQIWNTRNAGNSWPSKISS